MALRIALTLALLGRLAAADSPKLAQARQAVEAVHYDQAQALLVEALKEGGNSPAAVAEIYQLSASTAIVLGQSDVAEQDYRRWLALDPHASLSSDVAPKLRQPFIAAQAYMQAHGQLSVRVTRTSATDVDVAVESDPLAMVAAVALGDEAKVSLGVDHRARLAAHGTAAPTVVVLDELGNHLVELPVGEPPAEQPRPPPLPPTAMRHEVSGTPWVRRWSVWGLPALGLAIAGGLFLGAADEADQELQNDVFFSSEHFMSDAEHARKTRDRDAVISYVLLGTAAACAGTAIVMYVTRPSPYATIVLPTAAPGGAGLAVSGSW